MPGMAPLENHQGVPEFTTNEAELSAPGLTGSSQPLNEQPPNDMDVQDNPKLQRALEDASREAKKVTEVSKAQQVVDKIEARVMTPMKSNIYLAGTALYSSDSVAIKSSAEQVEDSMKQDLEIQALEKSVSGFAESSKVLMKALDEVAKLHPFIGVAVLAFKAVITLELKRKDNDRKLIALKLQMQDMMAVLLQLRYVKDPKQIGPEGNTLEGRMQGLMFKIANDITACGNACDAYAKKSLLAKVMKSFLYEQRLAGFATIFANRQKELEMALSVHTTLGVDSANRALGDLNRGFRSVDEKLNMIILFNKLNSPHEKELKNLIEAKGGGEACMRSDAALEELSLIAERQDRAPIAQGRPGSQSMDSVALANLKMELQEDVEDGLKENQAVFLRKLEVQKKQLVDSLEHAIEHPGDWRPDDRIIDPDLRNIWHGMGWKGSVKAHHVILALYDYFSERISDPITPQSHIRPPSPTPSVRSEGSQDSGLALSVSTGSDTNHGIGRSDDRWTLAYINMLHLQPLTESVDDNGTGFVSIKALNVFAASRPSDWSLPRWLAYWAAGWRSSVQDYVSKIYKLVQRMFKALDLVLPANRGIVDAYLADESFRKMELLLRSVNTSSIFDYDLDDRIRSYVDEEETRLDTNLQALDYHIDTLSTVGLITGPGRIERYLFPLLYLLLRHHCRMIKLSCNHVLDVKEFHASTGSLFEVFSAVSERIGNLVAVFKQTHFDVTPRMESFAFGMFQLLWDPNRSVDTIEDNSFAEFYGYDGGHDSENVSSDILKYGVQEEYDYASYDMPQFETELPDAHYVGGSRIEGLWSGHSLDPGESQPPGSEGLIEILIDPVLDNGSIRGIGKSRFGVFTITGGVDLSEESEFKVTLTNVYKDVQYGQATYQGKFDLESDIIRGKWTSHQGDTFCLRRTPASIYRFLFSPSQRAVNHTRARWDFACSAIRYQVRQRLWSWSFFKSRLVERRRYVELATQRELAKLPYTPRVELRPGENTELCLLEQVLLPADARFYDSLVRSRIRRLSLHSNAWCDWHCCPIVGSRIICLRCPSNGFGKPLSLCVNCIDKTLTINDFTHDVSHDIVKIKQVVHHKDEAKLIRDARNTADRVRTLLKPASGLEPPADSRENPSFKHSCARCAKEVSPPCWYCITCETDTFICDDCDAKGPPCLPGDPHSEHDDNHPIIRIRYKENAEEPPSLESRMATLEKLFADEQRVVDQRLTALESKVEGRLIAMEEVLQRIATRVAV